MRLEETSDDPGRAALLRAIERHRHAPLAIGLMRRGLGPYRGYAEMLGVLREIQERGARLEVIGESVDAEPLFAVQIGNPDAGRATCLLSGVHPLEWIGIETHLTLLERLADKPPQDRCVISLPFVNPDGIVFVERNLRHQRRRFVRHNRRRVDLNRNFPAFWGRASLARLLLGRVFRGGSAPASEPEVRAITAYLRGTLVDRSLSFHSFGGAVLYPYGAKLAAPVDVDEHRRWARHIARRADARWPYRAVQSSRWVPGFTAPGMELDWFHDQHGALSLLIECSRGGLALDLEKLKEPFAWFNPNRPDRSAPHIANAVESFVRGAVLPS